MKSTAFKKFDLKAYRAQINHDMKDRFHKLLYLLMFALSQSNREVQHCNFKLGCIFLVGMVIEWIKHTTVVNTSEKKISLDEITSQLREVYQKRKSCVLKCMDIDYNLLPLATFLLKISHTIYYTQNSSIQTTPILTVLSAFVVCEVLVPAIWLVYHTGSFVHRVVTQQPDEALLSDSEE